MKQYISKSALVAEIERRQSEHDEKKYDYASTDHFWRAIEDKDILSFINTLEVKEVDLEKEFKNFLDNVEGMPRMWHSDEQIEWAKDIARHFFELGLKAQKGE